MASSRLSSEIEGTKNRLFPVQQKSKIPVRKVTRLNSDSGTTFSSKDEVNMKQRILSNRAEKSQNKLPSRIPIAIGRTNSRDVGRNKIPKSVIAATGKRPFARDSGINCYLFCIWRFKFKFYVVKVPALLKLRNKVCHWLSVFYLFTCHVFIQSMLICLVVHDMTLLVMTNRIKI